VIDVRETLLRNARRSGATPQTRPDNFLLTTADDVLLEAFGHVFCAGPLRGEDGNTRG
jgi:hypothetical protein